MSKVSKMHLYKHLYFQNFPGVNDVTPGLPYKKVGGRTEKGKFRHGCRHSVGGGVDAPAFLQ